MLFQLFDLGPEQDDSEGDGTLLAETDECSYECAAREKFALLFEQPVPVQAHNVYLAWARISGPSSDCGSSGQATVTTDDQSVTRASLMSNRAAVEPTFFCSLSLHTSDLVV